MRTGSHDILGLLNELGKCKEEQLDSRVFLFVDRHGF